MKQASEDLRLSIKIDTVKTHIKEHSFFQFRLILFLYIGSFLQNEPEDVLKVFLNLFLEIIYCLYCQQWKLMCNHNVSLNELMILALTQQIKAIIIIIIIIIITIIIIIIIII